MNRWLMIIMLLFSNLAFAADTSKDKNAKDAFVEIDATEALLDQVRQGGYVLYMRHGPTDTSKPDLAPIDVNDCSRQRPLSELGKKLAVAVGRAVKKAAIPVGEVLASPMCRARGTAALAYGEGVYQLDELLMYTSHLTKDEKVPRVARIRELVSTPVAAGQNRVLVAHAPNLFDLMGYFPKLEATIVVFKPLGDSYEYLGSIKPHDWLWLLYEK
jgi:phosphohistidine phosphatase SixA